MSGKRSLKPFIFFYSIFHFWFTFKLQSNVVADSDAGDDADPTEGSDDDDNDHDALT